MPSLNRLVRILLVIGISLLGSTAWAQSSGAGQTVFVNGMEMYYEIHGQGEPLVLLHGFFGSGAGWVPFLDTFAAEYRVIVPDLRGHGRSTNPSNEFTHKQAALDVFALFDHLSVDEFQAMGISTGGMTLLHMATSQPERVDAMVLIGAASYFPDEDRANKRATDPETQPEEAWARMRQQHANGDDQIRALWTQFRDFEDNYDDMNFTAPYLSTITARTLIVHGDRDQSFPVNIPVEEYEAIPNSYLWIVPNGQHVPIFGATADYFTGTALAFLRGEWERQ